MTSKEAKNYLISLIERDTPKKVIKEVDYRDIYKCSNCNNVLIIDRYQRLKDKDKINYCGECGQRLDWS